MLKTVRKSLANVLNPERDSDDEEDEHRRTVAHQYAIQKYEYDVVKYKQLSLAKILNNLKDIYEENMESTCFGKCWQAEPFIQSALRDYDMMMKRSDLENFSRSKNMMSNMVSRNNEIAKITRYYLNESSKSIEQVKFH